MNKAREVSRHVDFAERALVPIDTYNALPKMQAQFPNVIHNCDGKLVVTTEPGKAVKRPTTYPGVVYSGYYVHPVPRDPQRNVVCDWDDGGADEWPQMDVGQMHRLGAGERVRVVLRDGLVPHVRHRDNHGGWYPCYSDTEAAAMMHPDGVPHEGNALCVYSIQ